MDSPEWRAASLVRSPLRHLGGPREDPRTLVVDVNVRWTSTEQWGRNRDGGKVGKGSDPFLFELDVLVGTVRPRPDTSTVGFSRYVVSALIGGPYQAGATSS